MRHCTQLTLLSAFLFFSSALPAADLWTGELFDANCVQQHNEIAKYDACIPAASTVAFVLQTSGQMLKLDAAGNRKAAQAWKQYIDNPSFVDPDLKTKAVTAEVEGVVTGDEIKVDSMLLR